MILRNQFLHGCDSLPALIYGVGVGMDNFVKHIHFVAFIKSCIRYFLGETCLCFRNRPVVLCFLCAVTHRFIIRSKGFNSSINRNSYHRKNGGECGPWISKTG